MSKLNIHHFLKRKKSKKKISMVTSYDYWSARIINKTDVDTILVGDSLAMVMHGHDSTIPATPEIIAMHLNAVRKGAPAKFIVADMPFLTFRKGKVFALETVEILMNAGANAVKLEGIKGHEDVVEHIVQSGVPVMGHLGLTPQSIHQIGGFKVQGQGGSSADLLLEHAKKLQDCGCFAIVLECVPADLAKKITDELTIPTIGIGAGVDVDGQVLVLQDLLGMDKDFNPKFLKKYLSGEELITGALNNFHKDVTTQSFPTESESY